jgi:hypothetical protein
LQQNPSPLPAPSRREGPSTPCDCNACPVLQSDGDGGLRHTQIRASTVARFAARGRAEPGLQTIPSRPARITRPHHAARGAPRSPQRPVQSSAGPRPHERTRPTVVRKTAPPPLLQTTRAEADGPMMNGSAQKRWLGGQHSSLEDSYPPAACNVISPRTPSRGRRTCRSSP